MNRRARFHRLVRRELIEAAQYYEHERPGLGAAFIDAVRTIITSLLVISSATSGHAQERLPIIDMHLHAYPVVQVGDQGLPNPVTGRPASSASDAALLRTTLAEMDKHGSPFPDIAELRASILKGRCTLPAAQRRGDRTAPRELDR